MNQADLFLRIFQMVSLSFLAQAMPPVLMLCIPCERRKHFIVRLIISIIVAVGIGAGVSYLEMLGNTWFGSLSSVLRLFPVYFILLVVIFAAELFLFKSSATTLLFNLLGGYAINQLSLFLFYALYYSIPYFASSDDGNLHRILMFSFLWLAYVVVFLIARKSNYFYAENPSGKRQPMLYLSIGISVFMLAFNLIRNKYVERRTVLDYACIICLMLFYVLILLFRGGMIKSIISEKEMMLTKRVWEEKEKSLKLTKEAVNTINIKYHDLKHMTSKLKNGENALELVNDITDSLKIYENSISTGNDTLDMVITEEMIKFRQNNVEFSCIADGSSLSFMSSIDIISLFSNALDNAFEAVINLNVSQRIIYLRVNEALGMLSISVENPYSSILVIQDGLPVTNKADKNYHGFGMRSILNIVKKHNGNLSISTTDGLFKLKILMPKQQ